MSFDAVFLKETEYIYRLKIPFETVYTSVFLIKSKSGVFLVDCATTEGDVDDVILPALSALGYTPSDVKAVIVTHKHSDHAGGLPRLLSHMPEIEVVTDVRPLCDGVSTYALPGHTSDFVGVLDTRTNTLLSGDGLQGAGVDKFRCSLENKHAYENTLFRLQNDERIENILFSHAYEPWNTDGIHGRENVLDCLRNCFEYIER